jgi:hypothetical protein
MIQIYGLISLLTPKVGRMMMNIRGLILDDPEHNVRLRTLAFASHRNQDSEVEEAT